MPRQLAGYRFVKIQQKEHFARHLAGYPIR
jgi:hypothetical protein